MTGLKLCITEFMLERPRDILNTKMLIEMLKY